MVNLTQARLVRLVPGFDPVPAHYLVVFKRTGAGGMVLRACLLPGQKFKKRFLESTDSLIAYAVPEDKNIQHRFGRSHVELDQIHTFALDCTITFNVTEPVNLVLNVSADPLRLLEDEIASLLMQATRSLGRPQIGKSIVFDREALNPLAVRFGITVKSVEVILLSREQDLLRRDYRLSLELVGNVNSKLAIANELAEVEGHLHLQELQSTVVLAALKDLADRIDRNLSSTLESLDRTEKRLEIYLAEGSRELHI